jgi:Predicted membrane protein (DUF2306)
MEQTDNRAPGKWSVVFSRWSGNALVATVWFSSGLFGLYILAFYAAALYEGDMNRWNNILPGLYTPGAKAASTGIGFHFATGGIILLLGSIQLIDAVRTRYPAVHRWIGRVYVLSSLLAAIGGLVFILAKGTIGGTVMNIGFALYGLLMLIAGVETYRHAVARRLDKHRAWALRLYALAVGSWLYRMDYGFWLLLADGLGHKSDFTGPFDQVMSFFFYLPNLLVAQIFISGRTQKTSHWLNILSALLLLVATGFLLLGTYYFTKFYWGPAILKWISGE